MHVLNENWIRFSGSKWQCFSFGPCDGLMMSAMASQITGVSIVYSIVCSSTNQGKHQRSSSLAFVRGIHRWPVNSPHKGPVKVFLIVMSLSLVIHGKQWKSTVEIFHDHPFSRLVYVLDTGPAFTIASPVTGEFPAQRTSNAENVFIWWRHHEACDISFSCNLLLTSSQPIFYIYSNTNKASFFILATCTRPTTVGIRNNECSEKACLMYPSSTSKIGHPK